MLEKKYDHKQVELNKYDNWKEKGYFKAGNDLARKPFCVVIPPPNVTGNLHLGHALNGAIQDVIIRYKRMDGYDTLWLPGMDHAAIATEAKVVAKLKKQGIDKYELGREKFLDACWDWTYEHKDNIHKQWAKLGLSVDYSKERFTLDEGLNKAVNTVFVKLYEEGLIYRGEKIINWDPIAKTALSNEEVIYKDDKGAFYHLKYFIEDSNDYLEVATTRPETLFGDTAVAVNPSDERYKDLIGKNVILPIVNKKIPIIGDIHADPTFGTGVVKITPAHDPNDFEVGERHNLERIVVMNEDATMNKNAGIYKGMTREECRERLVEDLKEKDLLIKIEEMTHSVGHSERTDAVVEPYLSKQWFVKMEDMANDLLECQKDADRKINFFPKNFEKILNHWMENCHDWCISRQLWWGHRIPAWYRNDEVYVGLTEPEGDGWVRDKDVLDTWFSSALWPFSTLGWPDKTEDLERYFPTDALVTAYDIIFFWVARMAFSSLKQMKTRPFKDCIIHGLIRDKQGRKMSKSLGNGIDPMDLIEEYGTDALRFYLTTASAMGTDIRFDTEKVASTWNFINKLWNASRFVLMNIEDFKEEDYTLKDLSISDKWILTKLNETIKNVRKNMDRYDFNNVGAILYSFIWDDFCDWYIELAKINMNNTTKSVLLKVLKDILLMLHPMMPFVTEEIYGMLPIKEYDSIMISEYPKYDKKEIFKDVTELQEKIIKDIVAIRNLKANNNITKDCYVVINVNDEYKNIYISQLKIKEEQLITTDYSNMLSSNYKSSLVDITYYYKGSEEDNSKLLDEIKSLEESINRRKKLLSNENYVNKAPKNIVDLDRKKLEEEEEKLAILQEKVK